MNRIGFIYRGMGRGTMPAPSVLPSGDTGNDMTEEVEIEAEESVLVIGENN
jgi:hypothetical protein